MFCRTRTIENIHILISDYKHIQGGQLLNYNHKETNVKVYPILCELSIRFGHIRSSEAFMTEAAKNFSLKVLMFNRLSPLYFPHI
jgi:hypothetical protein